MGGRRARAVIDTRFGFQQVNVEPLPGERERRHQADRAAAGDDDWIFGLHQVAWYGICVN